MSLDTAPLTNTPIKQHNPRINAHIIYFNMEMGARHRFHRRAASNIIMLPIMLLLLATSMCGVSAQHSNISNKSDSDLIVAGSSSSSSGRVQNRAFASSTAARFLASLPASLARVFGRTVTGESEGMYTHGYLSFLACSCEMEYEHTHSLHTYTQFNDRRYVL